MFFKFISVQWLFYYPFWFLYEKNESGEVLEYWKVASVIPIYMKSEKEDLGNYRAVSLTSAPGK